MAALKDKVQNALDESRILILGAQVFIGFQFRSILEAGFATLPVSVQYLRLGTLGGWYWHWRSYSRRRPIIS
jgi:hypothetical protein